MNNTISVIVTIHNSIAYLKDCLESICCQTYTNLEIILVDDGSTDGSELLCDEFKGKDDRIKVIHKANEGVVKARKVGCEACAGEYISIIDSDDWLEADMLEKLLSCCVDQNVDISMCGRIEEYPAGGKSVKQGVKAGRYNKGQLISDVYPNMIVNRDFFSWGIFPSYWDKLFKRDCIIPYVMEIDESIPMGNDAAGVYPALLNAGSIAIIDDCLYHYRQYQSSLVHKNYDPVKISRGFKALFQYGNRRFEKYSNVYDCREQWKKYVMFLAIPRADMMYRDMDKLPYLFPFPDVERGSRVVIYGMGLYGKRLYGFVERTGFCQLVAAIDRDYETFEGSQFKVDAPENICKYEFDHVVVALSYAGPRKSVYEFLKGVVPEEKISLMDENEIMSEKTLMALGSGVNY
ncbi:MAG: glycosyltransferase family 2 protein [Butyrivibrio sp.]|nr:glycosyltransferase family A protein [Butyrivibrio sp.]MBR1642058.1 glycosyltransferase family 2 protein [Butyrivibrio sp.]